MPVRRRVLVLLTALLMACVIGVGAPSPASAAVVLGPDVTTPPATGGFTFGAVGCQGGSYSPCLYLNTASTNPKVPIVAPISGVITKWRFRAGCCTEPVATTKTLTLVTAWLGSVPGYPSATVDLTGTSYELRPGDQLLSSSPPELPARLPIKAGQLVGVIADEPVAFSVDATFGGVTSSVMMNGVTYQGQRYGAATNAALMIGVDIEADADADGYGDETQDCNPADAATHDVGCAPPPVTGAMPHDPPSVGINCPQGGCPAPGAAAPAATPTPTPPPAIALVHIVGSIPASSDGTRFNVALGCPAGAAGPCRGVLVLDPAGGSRAQRLAAAAPKAARIRSYGRATYAIAAGRTAKVRVRLNAAGRRALRRKGKLTVSISVRPTGGEARSVTRTLRLKQPAGR